jgi:4-diphosphocytidyl-2-C-methyl-D-erythritol kinase
LVVFPNSKINLGLSVLNRRNDGFHNLETVFYPLPIKDVLEIIPAPDNNLSPSQKPSQVQFSSSGLSIDGDSNSNLCVKAYHLLQQDFPELPSVLMHLYKHIPMGAGMGGGSADGAFVLKLLNTMFNLGLSDAALIKYAAVLGSDCPFFIENRACLAEGRGEILQPLTLDLSKYSFVLVNPGIHINTGWAFSQLALTDTVTVKPNLHIKELVQDPLPTWKDRLINDFEKPAFSKYPEIKAIKDTLYHAGALYASMTGTGSSVYGIFENTTPSALAFPGNYRVIKVDPLV